MANSFKKGKSFESIKTKKSREQNKKKGIDQKHKEDFNSLLSDAARGKKASG